MQSLTLNYAVQRDSHTHRRQCLGQVFMPALGWRFGEKELTWYPNLRADLKDSLICVLNTEGFVMLILSILGISLVTQLAGFILQFLIVFIYRTICTFTSYCVYMCLCG